MSCGRNRRRPKLPSSLHSRLHNQHEFASANTQSTRKIHPFSHSRKSNQPKSSSKQLSRENVIDFDRFRILDDKGDDVTPRLITDQFRINLKNRHDDERSMTEMANKSVTEKPEASTSEKSLVGTMNLSTSTSHMLHTGTLFQLGKATLDIGARLILESEQLLNRTLTDRTSRLTNDNQESQAKFCQVGPGLQHTDEVTDDVMISETETMFILDLRSHVVSQDDLDEYDRVHDKNQVYIELCKNRHGNDLYIERSMQTFNDLPKQENIITDSVIIRSQQSWANAWDIHDSVMEANRYEGKIYRQYAMHTNENSNDNKVKLNEYQHSNVEGKLMSIGSSKTSSSQNSSAFFSEESLMKITPSKTNCFESNDSDRNKLPEMNVDALIMERILNLSVYPMNRPTNPAFSTIDHVKEEDGRISTIKDHDHAYSNKRDLSSLKYTNLSLDRLWHYTCHLTQNRNVSCLCWNQQNHDLLAVGYGKFQYNDDREGLVCCWNAKNPEFPERYYQTEAGVTSLSFSHKPLTLLAVGLFNGNICIFDVNQNNTPPIVDTNGYDKKHTYPVWQIVWNEPDRSSELRDVQVLLSISSDGRITQWILRKEFEATDLMHLKPYKSSKTTCQALTRNDGTYITGHFSNFVAGLCFDIRPNDKTIYLCGTDEGVIHRCSTISDGKYLESYIGHTGPVYKVHWSPFVPNIFLSVSADWSVRLWMIGCAQSCMIFSSSKSQVFFDAIWSPKTATMFFCVSESTIETWDLSKSTLDPIHIVHCTDQQTFTSIAYATDSDCILVGANDGSVWVYHLESLSSSGNVNDLNIIIQQSLCRQSDSVEENDIDQEISLTSTQHMSRNNDQHSVDSIVT